MKCTPTFSPIFKEKEFCSCSYSTEIWSECKKSNLQVESLEAGHRTQPRQTLPCDCHSLVQPAQRLRQLNYRLEHAIIKNTNNGLCIFNLQLSWCVRSINTMPCGGVPNFQALICAWRTQVHFLSIACNKNKNPDYTIMMMRNKIGRASCRERV